MADRPSNEKYKYKVDFFGKIANFNKNPFKYHIKQKLQFYVLLLISSGLQKYKVKTIKLDLNFEKKENEAIEIAIKNMSNYLKIF